MAKRGLNIYRRADGRWEGRVRGESSPDGKRRYRSLYGKSYREVREKMVRLEAERGRRTEAKRCGLSVAEVVDVWVRDRRSAWKESTYACYMRLVERHISGGIGRQRADTFTNAAFHAFLDGLKKKADGSKISSSYANSIGTVLRQAFAHGCREYHYALPALKCRRLPNTGKSVELPPEKSMERLKGYLYGHTENATCVGVLLACCTGVRIGELCALTWGDIDLEEGVLKVDRNLQRIKDCREGASGTRISVQSPKTPSSARRIPLPEGLLEILRERRGAAGEYLVKGRRKPWAEVRTVQYRFSALLKRCGVERFRFHALRHYFASQCIRRGFDVKSLSEILGHVNTQITLNLYVHSSMERKRELMNRAFPGEGA